jgi:hypothetical protein
MRFAALAFPTVFLESGTRARLVLVCWESSEVMFLHTYLQSQDSRNCRVGWTLVGQDGDLASRAKLFSRFFSCDSDFYMRFFLAFVSFQVSWSSAVVQRSRKHVSVCPWCWEAVFASLLGILFQRQRPQQWPRTTRVSFASGQLICLCMWFSLQQLFIHKEI